MTGNDYDEPVAAEPRLGAEPPRRNTDEGDETRIEPPPFDREPTDTAWPRRDAGEPTGNAPEPVEPQPQPVQPQLSEEPPPAAPPAGASSDEGTAAEPTPDASVEPEADEDPFATWPQPQSGVVVEDEPEDGVSVEHVEGEIDVPDGYAVLEGMPIGRRRSVGIVVSRFNGGLTNRMLASALDALEEAEVSTDAITVVPVPGAFELPLAAMALAKTRRYACIIALGAVVRGETPHFDFVASEAASGLQLAAIETGVPVAFGVLTVETIEQGEARIGRAADAVRSGLEMADLFARLRASAH